MIIVGTGIQRLITDNAVFWIDKVKRQQQIMPLPNLVTQAIGALKGGVARLGPLPRVHLIPAVQHASLGERSCLYGKPLTAQPAAHHLLSTPGVVREVHGKGYLVSECHCLGLCQQWRTRAYTRPPWT